MLRLGTRPLLIIFLTIFVNLVGFGIIIPLLPLYVKSMGGSAETVGILLSSFSLTQLVATPLLGRLSDSAGRRRVILVSLAGNAASMVLFSAASFWHALPLLFVSRILAGATAGNLAACQAAVADVSSVVVFVTASATVREVTEVRSPSIPEVIQPMVSA